MIRIVRIAAATLLLAGALTFLFFASGTVHRSLALCFAVLSAFWLSLPFLESAEERGRTRASSRRTLSSGALFAGTAIVAMAAIGKDPLLGGVGAVVAELLVLFVWLMSVLPALAPSTEEHAARKEEEEGSSTYLQRRNLRLGAVFLAGAGSALAALGLSSAVRVPSLLIVLVGFTWSVLTLAVIRRFTITVRSSRGVSSGARTGYEQSREAGSSRP